jgi:DNA polymerase III epsilon subunit-like protein
MFFNEEMSGAHDAMVDTRACMRVYFELIDRGNWSEQAA